MLSISIIFVKKNNLQICHQCIHFLCLFEQFAKSLSDPSVEQVYLNTDPAKDKKGGKLLVSTINRLDSITININKQRFTQIILNQKQINIYFTIEIFVA